MIRYTDSINPFVDADWLCLCQRSHLNDSDCSDYNKIPEDGKAAAGLCDGDQLAFKSWKSCQNEESTHDVGSDLPAIKSDCQEVCNLLHA